MTPAQLVNAIHVAQALVLGLFLAFKIRDFFS